MAKAVAKAPIPNDKIEIIKWDGKKISKPGVYDMPLEAYHSDCCVGPSISSSGLRTIMQRSPAHYWFDSYLNPKRVKDEKDRPHFSVGKAAHTLLLGEGGFAKQYSVRPDTWADYKTNAAKAWREQVIAAGKTPLIPKDIEAIEGMAASMSADPIIRGGLFNGLAELSLIWKDEETGVWLKARPDTIQADGAMLVDLKTIEEASDKKCYWSVRDYAYHAQLALGCMGMKALLNRDITMCVLVFIEKAAPYLPNVKTIHQDTIGAGAQMISDGIIRFAQCLEANEWPGYPDSGNTLTL